MPMYKTIKQCYLYKDKFWFASKVFHIFFLHEWCQQTIYGNHLVCAKNHTIVIAMCQNSECQAVDIIVFAV